MIFERVISLTPTPPANALVAKEDLGKVPAFHPLDVHLCMSCGHLQLLDVVDPRELFEDYVYVSGTSPTFQKHFVDYAAAVFEREHPKPGELVVDIGSNDGTLLRAFEKLGMRVLGVDPARDIAADATAAGIPTIAAFFDKELASEIVRDHGPARIVCANNVLAHIDDLGGVIDAVAHLLSEDGILVFEVAYARDMYEKTLFDTIYHEHLDYHTIKPLVQFFQRHGLELVACPRVVTHGGSIRGFVARGGRQEIEDDLGELTSEEDILGLATPETWRKWANQIDALGTRLKDELRNLKGEGLSIAAYGAPAKATTLLHHFGIGSDDIDYIVDDNPRKQGLYIPGLGIPIVDHSRLDEQRPDLLLVLAWNFAESIMAKEDDFHRKGGRFIVPLPELSIR